MSTTGNMGDDNFANSYSWQAMRQYMYECLDPPDYVLNCCVLNFLFSA